MLKKNMAPFVLSFFLLSLSQNSIAKENKNKKDFNIISYVKEKICEIPQMRLTHDLRLWQINRYIKKKHKSRKFSYVQLSKLKQLHPVTRTQSMVKVEKRVKAIQEAGLLNLKRISRNNCDKAMPSITPIQVAMFNKNTYYIFEGNGRLVSLKKAFEGQEDLGRMIEVEVFDLSGNDRVLRKIEVLRRKNGLEEPKKY